MYSLSDNTSICKLKVSLNPNIINIAILAFSDFVPDAACFHEVVQIEAGIIGMYVLRRSSRMCVLHAVRVHGDLEGLQVGADGAVRGPGDRVDSRRVQTIQSRAAVPGQRCILGA